MKDDGSMWGKAVTKQRMSRDQLIRLEALLNRFEEEVGQVHGRTHVQATARLVRQALSWSNNDLC